MRRFSKFIQKRLTSSTTLCTIAALLTACASTEDKLTGVPIASVSHYEKGKSVSQFLINNRGAGSNLHGGYSSPTSTISLDRNFSGPLTLDVKWKVCNFVHYIKDKKKENFYCIYEQYERKVPVHVLNTPAERAYLYLHFFKDNTVEAWMTKSVPESENYPGPIYPRDTPLHE